LISKKGVCIDTLPINVKQTLADSKIQVYFIETLLQLLAEQGVTEAQIYAQLQLSPEEILQPRQDEDFDVNALLGFLALSGDAQFGLRLGSRTNLLSQGIYGLALMSSATLGDALRLLIRYSRSILPQVNMALNQSDNGAELIITAGAYPQAVERFFCEVTFAGVLNHGAMLLNQDMKGKGIAVELDYRPTTNLHLYEEVLGPQVTFNAPRRALFCDSECLAQPISTANPLAGDFFLRECDRLFTSAAGLGRLSERVQQLLLQSSSNFPTAAGVAEQLHMSERTLQRRLGSEGTRYQPLLDEVRYRLAREYLLGTELPVVAVAELLGFSDAANFRRSFKRWSQLTPAQLRDGARAEG